MRRVSRESRKLCHHRVTATTELPEEVRMCRQGDTAVIALADDLSGAAEAAALLRLPARLVLHADDLGLSGEVGEAVVVDLDSRYLDDGAAADAVRTVLRAVGRQSPARRGRHGITRVFAQSIPPSRTAVRSGSRSATPCCAGRSAPRRPPSRKGPSSW
ncbi:hypothetical protein GCM10023238_06680 [Streptomyces heliomycini]